LGVDIDLFAPAPREAPKAGLVIGYVGRLERHKGVDVLMRAVAEKAEWRLLITGDGSQRAELVRLAKELAIVGRVEFLGHASDEELAARYRDLDVIAVPSLPWPGWSEQFCRVAVEAMASGVPVVASATGAIPDVVADSGVLVEPGDPAALRSGLSAAAEPERWALLRERGLARSAEYSWRRVAEMHRALYAEVLSAPGARGQGDLEVLVVAYGSPHQLEGCLAALGAELPVTVIDNSSLASTRKVARAHGARYVDAGANLGFAGGVNRGLADLAARGAGDADVLLLNPDARITGGSVLHMHELLRRQPRVAAMGAEQRSPDGERPVRVWWPFPTPWGAWVEAVGLGRLRRSRSYAIGSVLLLRAEAIEQVGVFDERFFLYAEEADWQLRARRLGWSIDVAPVTASHEGGGTGGDPLAREAHFYGSAEHYIRKHYGRSGWRWYRAANVVGATLRGLVLPGARGAAARRRRDIFVQGPAQREARWR
ncbi:MAG: glycosyltransferase, partial [Demequinaceae bacterium]|nr:glycosyltransferase [Demequinaceae bacterium]